MTSSELNLHPVVAFSSTIVGGAVAGVLGATLSAPVLSMVLRIKDRVQDYQPPTAQTRPPPGPDPLGAGAAVPADEGPTWAEPLGGTGVCRASPGGTHI